MIDVLTPFGLSVVYLTDAMPSKGDSQTFNRFPFGPTWSLTMIEQRDEREYRRDQPAFHGYDRQQLRSAPHAETRAAGQPVQAEEGLTPAVSVRRSVHHDYVVCLDCGYRGKMLQRHISTRHELNRDEYLKRWGLRNGHPLTAPAYSERRSTMAKALGFGQKPKAQATSGDVAGQQHRRR